MIITNCLFLYLTNLSYEITKIRNFTYFYSGILNFSACNVFKHIHITNSFTGCNTKLCNDSKKTIFVKLYEKTNVSKLLVIFMGHNSVLKLYFLFFKRNFFKNVMHYSIKKNIATKSSDNLER